MAKIIRATTVSSSLHGFCEIQLKELSQENEVIALSSPDDLLQDVGERCGVRIIGVPMERRVSLMKDLRSLCRLYRVFRHERPDMVHSMTPKAGLLCMLAGWMARVPVRVHTFTGLVWPTAKGLQRKILMTTDRITCACATHVIPEGWGVLDDLKDHGITRKPMRVLGYGNVRGIDLTYWDKKRLAHSAPQPGPAAAVQAGESPFTFLFVGRLVGDKGINELVTAFERLLTQVKEVKSERGKELEMPHECRLVLVGDYEEKLDPVSAETRRLIETMPEIEAVGPQFGDDLLAWYAAADCFVFPSYREGFPNTVIEAGAMELPCIVTDINGSNEIIRRSTLKGDGQPEERRLRSGERMSVRETGVVIASKDEDALCEAMLWMMEHPAERNAMGKRAREDVSARFEQGFVREQLYAFYREILGS